MTTRPIQLDSLAGQPGLRHGFFTREGGVSEGIYASLNCGYGAKEDIREAVSENRRRALAAFDLSPASLVTVYQIHSARVAVVDKDDAWTPNENPEADGLVTNRRGVALGILTADCVPILFADAEAGVIGAAHAGWKGAFSGIAEATVEAMVGLGARRGEIRAAIGPAIQQASYEVDSQFRAHFLARDGELDRFFRPGNRAGHHQFDLPGFVEDRLRTLEIGTISRAKEDTKTDAARFFSYRRATLNGEPDYGRQLSAIALV